MQEHISQKKTKASSNAVGQKSNNTPTFQFADNRSNTVAQRRLGNLGNRPDVYQLKGGSHGKKLKLNVKGTYTSGDDTVAFNDRDQDISIVKGHGGYTDQDALAEEWVRTMYSLADDSVVTIEKYNFYTAR